MGCFYYPAGRMPLPEAFPARILRGVGGTLLRPWATQYEELTNFVSDRTWEFDMNFCNGVVWCVLSLHIL